MTVDFARIMERMRKIRADISWNDSAKRFSGVLGVDVFFGRPRFIDETSLQIDGTGPILKFSRCVIGTGSRPYIPLIEGLAGTPYLTNETLFNLTKLPETLVIVGGGVIGCEMGQAFARFGSRVTIILRGNTLLRNEDPEAVAIVEKALVADGITILRDKIVSKVAFSEDSRFLLHLNDETSVVAEHLLIATGRAPNVGDLNLEAANVEYSPVTGIQVDDYLRTTSACIYAAGDCCSFPLKFTHAADLHARTIIRNALFMGRAHASALVIPWCTYTDPELAHVGWFEKDATEKNVEFETFRVEFSDIDRAICTGDTEGFVKILAEKGTGKVLGATIVGSNAGDMISAITTAIVQQISLQSIANIIHPYPTLQEAVRKCGDLYNRTRLTSTTKIVLRKFLDLRR